mmetsp:Transcript_2490/g.7361  ORF Transcript_2490/g.7361 Transcript_2490/m.7361 type:complete len:289 (+) Transcript_2490:108-974(+)
MASAASVVSTSGDSASGPPSGISATLASCRAQSRAADLAVFAFFRSLGSSTPTRQCAALTRGVITTSSHNKPASASASTARSRMPTSVPSVTTCVARSTPAAIAAETIASSKETPSEAVRPANDLRPRREKQAQPMARWPRSIASSCSGKAARDVDGAVDGALETTLGLDATARLSIERLSPRPAGMTVQSAKAAFRTRCLARPSLALAALMTSVPAEESKHISAHPADSWMWPQIQSLGALPPQSWVSRAKRRALEPACAPEYVVSSTPAGGACEMIKSTTVPCLLH